MGKISGEDNKKRKSQGRVKHGKAKPDIPRLLNPLGHTEGPKSTKTNRIGGDKNSEEGVITGKQAEGERVPLNESLETLGKPT